MSKRPEPTWSQDEVDEINAEYDKLVRQNAELSAELARIKGGATEIATLSLPNLERVLRLLTYALHRRDLGLDDFSAEMLALNQGYIEEAKELLAELAKRDVATFTRKVIEQGEPKESPDDEFERELKEYPAPGSDPNLW